MIQITNEQLTVNNEINEKLEVRSEERNDRNFLYSLIPLDEFKALMGVDDRDDKLCRFCLVTSTLTIEEYCKRKFLRKQYFETIKIRNNYLLLTLKEYPVTEIVSMKSEQLIMKNGGLIDPIFYRPYPGCVFGEELPFELLFSSSLIPYKLKEISVTYIAGYQVKSEKLEMRNDLVCNHNLEQQNKDIRQDNFSLLTSHSSFLTANF